jgi:hypothetical protein
MARNYRFLHLGVNLAEATTTAMRGQIETTPNTGRDWFRYVSNCWLIYTELDPQDWHERLKYISSIAEHPYLICAADLNERAGCLPKSAWDWISKHAL